MKEIQKIVLLTDETTSSVGRLFFEKLAGIFRRQGKQVTTLPVRTDQNLAEAVYRFDEISRIKPDLLFVADFACIRMQSAEEEPMYNNLGIPTIHILFRISVLSEQTQTRRAAWAARRVCVLQGLFGPSFIR